MPLFLIADDSLIKAQMLKMLVERVHLNLDIVIVPSTEEAKNVIDEQEVQAAFIDFEMPTEQGPAVIRYLKEKNPDTPVACVSSANGESYREAAKDAGADTYICTSVQEDIFVHQIRDVLEEWKVLLSEDDKSA